MCDGVCVGIYGGKRERIEFLQTSLEALHEAQATGSLTAEHFLHLRCEVSDPHVVEMFEPLLEEPTLKLVSFMDHTPGQRQWHDIDKYRTFHRGRTEASEEEFQALIERRIEEQKIYADQHRQTAAGAGAAAGRSRLRATTTPRPRMSRRPLPTASRSPSSRPRTSRPRRRARKGSAW